MKKNVSKLQLAMCIIGIAILAAVLLYTTFGNSIVGDWELVGMVGMTDAELAELVTLDGSELGMAFSADGTGYFVEAGRSPLTWDIVDGRIMIDDGWHDPYFADFTLTRFRLTINFGWSYGDGHIFGRIIDPPSAFIMPLMLIALLTTLLDRMFMRKMRPALAHITNTICGIALIGIAAISAIMAATALALVLSIVAILLAIVVAMRFATEN